MCPFVHFNSIRLFCMHGVPHVAWLMPKLRPTQWPGSPIQTRTKEEWPTIPSITLAPIPSFTMTLSTCSKHTTESVAIIPGGHPQAPDPNSILLASNTCLGHGLHKLVFAGGSPFPSLWLRHPPPSLLWGYKLSCPAIPLNRSGRPCKAYYQAAAFEIGKLDLGTTERWDRKFSNYAGITGSESETLFQYDETRWKGP